MLKELARGAGVPRPLTPQAVLHPGATELIAKDLPRLYKVFRNCVRDHIKFSLKWPWSLQVMAFCSMVACHQPRPSLYLSRFLPAGVGWRWRERTAGKQTPIYLEEPGASGEVIKILLPMAERKPVINLTAPLIFSVPFTTKHCLLAVSLFSVPSGEKNHN